MVAAVPSCPLRVVAHIDLDAYYAQCEMLRLGIPDDTPLAVQQWHSLIAVNYPARAFGINRMTNAVDALKLCPSLVLQHVATWKEGEPQWAYHPDAEKAMSTHKVSLEPYRIHSRQIQEVIKECLPKGRCSIEKAGIDEVFLDLSTCVYDVLCDHYPQLSELDHPGDQPLFYPPFTNANINWAATGSGVIHPEIVHGEAGGDGKKEGELRQGEGGWVPEDVDWDDIAMMEGARIVQAVRAAIFDRLHFRCSAGIASNKLLSKLGSSQHKPNRQTIIRPRAAYSFLASLPSVTRLRGLGGKLGDRIVNTFDTQSIAELQSIPLVEFQRRFGSSVGDEDNGNLYQMLRGVDYSEVISRTEIKSLISAKTFRPPLTTIDQARRWLRVFVAEIHSRLLDERLSQALTDTTITVGSKPAEVQQGPVEQGLSENTKGGMNVKADEETAIASPVYVSTSASCENKRGCQEKNQIRTQMHTSPQRLPQIMRLHFGMPGRWRSRQTRIPRDGMPLDEVKLVRIAGSLLEQIRRHEPLLPCPHLAISLGDFEGPPISGTRSIATFFLPIQEQSSGSLISVPQDQPLESYDRVHSCNEPLMKRRRIQEDWTQLESTLTSKDCSHQQPQQGLQDTASLCCNCCHNKYFTTPVQLQEHQDWHVAQLLQAKEESAWSPMFLKPASSVSASSAHSRGAGSKRTTIPISTFFKKAEAASTSAHVGKQPVHDKNAEDTTIAAVTAVCPSATSLTCTRCASRFGDTVGLQIHEDWHIADDLSRQ